MTKTVTGLFDDYSDASSAVDQLKAAGVSDSDISIVSNNSDGRHKANDNDAAEDAGTGAGIGAAVGGVGGLLTGLGIMAIPGVGPVVAAGWLAATAAGAAAGAVVGGVTGGIVGALTDSGVDERDAHVYAEGVRRGGTLVTAKVDDARATEAEAILQRSNWVDLPARRTAYEGQGWTSFDERSDPYSQAEIDAERGRYAGRASII
ncbi:MAG TPA: general stress protein [Pararhizobium sp.]|uniref:general stress protein n=1 Tax=Pararhizobium sp. TaxID=1977563 RepID=UPI002CBA2584|nr:general stress protein [Pararhizobium sp.]HTO30535.1 general stress protein [Pararhizobium sp.]